MAVIKNHKLNGVMFELDNGIKLSAMFSSGSYASTYFFEPNFNNSYSLCKEREGKYLIKDGSFDVELGIFGVEKNNLNELKNRYKEKIAYELEEYTKNHNTLQLIIGRLDVNEFIDLLKELKELNIK